MAVSKRLAPVALVVVALALTVTGVVLAATDSNPSGRARDPFQLMGYPPKSANLRVVVSAGPNYQTTADVNVNFVTNNVEAKLSIPLVLSATSVELRLVNNQLFLGSANLSSVVGDPWVSVPLSQPSLFGYSLEMTKPDIWMIKGLGQEKISKSGYSTTYTFQRDKVVLGSTSQQPVRMPGTATLRVSITVGSQGEVTGAVLTLTSKTTAVSITATVLSYNQPARIAAPPATDVKPESIAQLEKQFGVSSLSNLLLPQSLATLGQLHLN